MSMIIPARQLTRTIITVRCDAPHTAPQIECALDEQTPFGHPPRQVKSSFGPSADGRPSPSASTTCLSPTALGNTPQADLAVERGVDLRGHFVRLSFLSAPPCTSQYDGQRHFEQVIRAPYGPSNNVLSGPTPSPRHAQEATSLQPSYERNMPGLTNGSTLVHPSAPIINNAISPTTAEGNPVDVENIAFAFPSDVELMSALDSFMNVCDFSQSWDSLMRQPSLAIPGVVSSPQSFSQTSAPASPEMSSSSSSSSSTNSPTTPFNFFLPAPSPTTDGTCNNNGQGGAVGTTTYQGSSESSLTSSPTLAQLIPSPEPKVGAHGKPNESRLLPCPQPGCRRQFKSTSTLSGHMKTHAGKGARFACSYPPCAEKFSRRHDQLRHEVYKHGKRCEWVCARCNSFFSYERSLEKHTCTMDKSRRGSVPYLTASPGGEAGPGR